MRGLTNISQVISSNNPKEVQLIAPLADFIGSQFDKIESYVKETAIKLQIGGNRLF